MDKRGKFLNKLGNRIQDCLYDRDMKQADLTEKTGFSSSMLSDYIKGKNEPGAFKIATIARALGVTTDYLLGLTDAPTVEPNLRGACDYTGLSDKTVQVLQAMTHMQALTDDSISGEHHRDMLEWIIDGLRFWEFVDSLISLIYAKRERQKTLSSKASDPPSDELRFAYEYHKTASKCERIELLCEMRARKVIASVIKKAMKEAP